TSSDSLDTLLFCPICSKPFDQETTQVRHVQYCRRRVARRAPPRPKACQACRKTKTKCNFGSPCSTCTTRQVACTYEKGRNASLGHRIAPTISMTNEFDVNWADMQTGSPLPVTSPPAAYMGANSTRGQNVLHRSTSFCLRQQDHARAIIFPNTLLDDGRRISLDEGLSPTGVLVDDPTATSTSVSGHDAVDVGLDLDYMDGIGTYDTTGNGMSQLRPDINTEISSIAAPRSTSVLSPSHNPPAISWPVSGYSSQAITRFSAKIVSQSCRKFIASTICTYPRMMLRPDSLPPFMHRHSCGLGQVDSKMSPQVTGIPSQSVVPESLAICISICHIFATKTASSEKFFCRTVDAELRRLNEEVPGFSKGETLAAIQAVLIYIIMRFFDADPSYFLANGGMFMTLQKLSEHFAELCPGPFSTVDSGHSECEWTEWIFDETRRRVAGVGFLLSVITGPENCNAIADPRTIPLPSSKALWDSESRVLWKKNRDNALAEPQATQARLCNLGDLIAVQQRAMQYGPADSAQENLGTWLATTDGLGLMLAAVTAGL
ncbi:hypothetical protein V8C40DRAFT_287257, partial [Trichoderma camerunense]